MVGWWEGNFVALHQAARGWRAGDVVILGLFQVGSGLLTRRWRRCGASWWWWWWWDGWAGG